MDDAVNFPLYKALYHLRQVLVEPLAQHRTQHFQDMIFNRTSTGRNLLGIIICPAGADLGGERGKRAGGGAFRDIFHQSCCHRLLGGRIGHGDRCRFARFNFGRGRGRGLRLRRRLESWFHGSFIRKDIALVINLLSQLKHFIAPSVLVGRLGCNRNLGRTALIGAVRNTSAILNTSVFSLRGFRRWSTLFLSVFRNYPANGGKNFLHRRFFL